MNKFSLDTPVVCGPVLENLSYNKYQHSTGKEWAAISVEMCFSFITALLFQPLLRIIRHRILLGNLFC